MSYKRIFKIILVLVITPLTQGCVVGAAVNVVGETVETAVELTGTTARTGGAIIGGTIDAIIPGDQNKPDNEE